MHLPIRLATFALTALLVSGCGSGDEPGTRATEAPTPDAPADPCPDRIPGPGPMGPASAAPDLTLSETTWVCEYELADKGWALEGDPTSVDASQLPDLQEAVDELEPSRQDAMCTMDIGPRWMLVTAEGADLRSVLADAFGCRNVLVTNDPVEDPAGGGSLSSPADLVDALQRAHHG